jgi:hypothetical protein
MPPLIIALIGLTVLEVALVVGFTWYVWPDLKNARTNVKANRRTG